KANIAPPRGCLDSSPYGWIVGVTARHVLLLFVRRRPIRRADSHSGFGHGSFGKYAGITRGTGANRSEVEEVGDLEFSSHGAGIATPARSARGVAFDFVRQVHTP